MALKLKLLGAEKEPLQLKLGDNIKVELGSKIFKPLEVTENGIYEGGEENGLQVGFTPVKVNVNIEKKIEPLTITENGTYSSTQIDGYNPVNVNVPIPSDTTAQVGDIIEGKTAYIDGLKQIGTLKAKKFTTGTVIFTTVQPRYTITHNLGVTPSVFLMLVKDKTLNFTFNAEDRPVKGIYGAFYINILSLEDIFTNSSNMLLTNVHSILEWRDNNSTALQWCYGGSGVNKKPNAETIQLSYRNASYNYLVNVEYEWIAIE